MPTRERQPKRVARTLLDDKGREDALKLVANRKSAYTFPTVPSWARNDEEAEFWESVRREIVQLTE